MKTCRLIVILLLLLPGYLYSQSTNSVSPPNTSCGQQEITSRLFNSNPAIKQFQQQTELILREYNKKIASGNIRPLQADAIVTLPVVVHIIHNNGAENISDAQVITAIQHLNEAFANTGYYDPADGVNTQIQFCLAQRDPNNNPTNGIDRVVSPLTVMDGWNNSSQDMAVKNLSRWDPRCYINIWLVKEIVGAVAGYAYLPSAHGMNIDGIVGEAAYFGSSYPNDVLIIHEMGHYLGLYHTFQGGCTNNDCSKDGDQVCDTPPDQSTAGIGCNSTANSCSTDALSGFSSDVNDLHTDYLDYGNWNCMKVFTQGQANRMNWFIQNVRKSLTECKSCLSPCPTPVTANFSSSATNISIGTTVNFNNSSVNASSYNWYINNIYQSSTTNYSFTFITAGTYIIRMAAQSSSPLCDSALKYDTIRVTCPVVTNFTPVVGPIILGQTVNFINSSVGATAYQWSVNGSVLSGAANFTYTFTTPGPYNVQLIGTNGICSDTTIAYFPISDTASGPVDTCGRASFQKKYSARDALELTMMSPSLDGGTIHCGALRRVDFPQTDAVAVKLTTSGNVQWATAITNLFVSSFTSIKETKDGGYIAVGIYQPLGSQRGPGMLMVKFSYAGTILWEQHFEAETGNIWPEDVIELNDGAFAIVGSKAISVNNRRGVIMTTDANGNSVWKREYRVHDGTQFNSVVQSGDNLVVAGTNYIGTRYAGTVVVATINTGTVQSSITFQDASRGNWKNMIYKTGYGYFVSTHITNYQDFTGKQTGLIRLDENLQVLDYYTKTEIDETPYTVAVPLADTGYLIPTSYNAGILMMAAGYSGNLLNWGDRFAGSVGSTSPINALSRANGQIMIGAIYLDGPTKTSFVLVKTDRGWKTPGCEDDPPTQSTTLQSLNRSALQWQDITMLMVRPKEQLTYYTQTVPITVSPLCANCDSVVDKPDTCTNVTFQETIGGPGEDYVKDIKVLTDGSYLLVGNTTSTAIGSGQTISALYMNVSPKGDILWQKKISGNGANNFTKILLAKNGDRLIFGNTYAQHNVNGSMLVTRIDNMGNIIWAREHDFRNASHTGFLNVADVIELPSGEFAFCGTASGINTDVGDPLAAAFNIIGVLRADGNMKWIRRFREYYTESGGNSLAIQHLNNWLFVSTSYGIMKLTTTDGTPTGLNKKFLYLGGFNTLEVSGSNLLASSGVIRTLLDQNLQVLGAWRIQNNDINYGIIMGGTGAVSASTSQGMVLKQPVSTERNLFLTKIEGMNNKIWSYKYPFKDVSNMRYLEHARKTGDNGFVVSGISYREINERISLPRDILLVRTDSVGAINDCPRSTVDFELNPLTDYSYLELHARTYPLISQTYTLNLQPENANLVVQRLCVSQDCGLIALIDRDTVCNLRDTLTLRVTRNANCDAFTDWVVDTTVAKIVSANDSMLVLLFKMTGEFKIKARIIGGCKIIEDSTLVTVYDAPDSLNLGPDIQLCKISTYTLKAPKGFKSYTWQDGSTDSTLTIYNPGVYHLTAEDYCGNLYRDTVNITQAPDIPFDLGPDREICLNDTVTINAPSGFGKYYWSPVYRINNAYLPTIKVSPLKDTTYIVIAEKSVGCVVTDSIRVKVNRPAPLSIGADTSFCEKDTISISANPGFSSYLWNTGSSSQTIRVANKGRYTVVATDMNGCKVRDTMEVLSLYNLPVVNLGNDLSICDNKPHEFDAGNHSNYLWQDGSVNRKFVTTQTGNYWVRVTDSRGCSNNDSVTIVSTLNSPSGFLDNEAEICVGQRLEIKGVAGYSKYRWYNNASAPAITVTAPGEYWLEVTNTDGCTSRDTIMVKAKDCIKGIFFPNAFTPFKGRANNYFRPIVYGQLESYHLVVMNRYGQKVFESKDPFQGWDGKLNGQQQGTNTFTWSCTYRFTGDVKVQNDKGFVVLVH